MESIGGSKSGRASKYRLISGWDPIGLNRSSADLFSSDLIQPKRKRRNLVPKNCITYGLMKWRWLFRTGERLPSFLPAATFCFVGRLVRAENDGINIIKHLRCFFDVTGPHQ
ncbi:hypothetical protein NXC12_PE00159 (plasmid) [Rhizobium etli]|uniref:Uncharacterized protein n=1 Tax=Rhizobium etli TaxID=29449 RepID=A0AAN1BM23_RHIET|nr:hypothetical protein REMIM1_PF00964 [Rhizobium etli bv. mimosae str. Mim1]ARQ13760.1 hypothetical protein NXC12_PE00159 [Rhizobium etli]